MSHRKKISFKSGTPAERLRREIADKIKKRNPNIPEARKFKMATQAAKRVIRARRRKAHKGS